ncbi:PQQ-dependent sugar dehydrogenase [Chitinophaga sp. GCM10012297]|uniref:PQQ-dependent sugar dehydrogenase n=1 Tax=Chitinophaga chungangae TaxID=2821488 RepID=A0ABS3YH71_9BACT|nr:PQQ-dependent sugar dehydrogenase [Chitinophaga chungangae]MBO9154034.1 PQQ-dependent sugar dehydrogenase [Chitinophaga chungangae]
MRNYSMLLQLLLVIVLTACYSSRRSKGGGQTNVPAIRETSPADIVLPEGYTAEVVASGLNFPTAVCFNDEGVPYVIEAGYSYGEVFTVPRLLKIVNGETQEVMKGNENGPWTGIAWHKGNFYIAEGGQKEGGKILKVTPEGKQTVLVDGLPGNGDHHLNGPVVMNDHIYFGTGSVTNSGVVGPDNADFGWLHRFPRLHDIPCQDITLAGVNYEAADALNKKGGAQTVTGAYLPFDSASTEGMVIKGKLPCSGAILRVPLQGKELQLVAWGLRNPYGLAESPDGKLYVTENGPDVRGSRPIWGTGDVLWEINEGSWYGWPDFMEGKPVALFKRPGGAKPQKVLQTQPGEVPKPVATLAVHSSSNGIDFSTSETFGWKGEAFIAQFGDMAPGVGKVLSPVGFRVVRVNVNSGSVEDFMSNRGKKTGPASWLGTKGLERPVSVQFDPSGKSLYVVDFGILQMTGDGQSKPVKNTGVLWKITKKSSL